MTAPLSAGLHPFSQLFKSFPLSHKKIFALRRLSGRDDWIRTSGPFVPNEVRYRAALHPENFMPVKLSRKQGLPKKYERQPKALTLRFYSCYNCSENNFE